MILRFKFLALAAFVFIFSAGYTLAQTENKTEEKKPSENKTEEKKEGKQSTANPKIETAEQVAESSILLYGGFGGRETLDRIRKTTVERGRITVTNADGTVDRANYERWIIRSGNLDKERIRLDQQFPNTRYSLVYDGEKTFGVFNNTVFSPKEDASKTFQNQIWHGLEALLRYKENDSKLNLAGREKIMGVEYYLLDVADKQSRKTRFYVSTKSFRVMMLEYEQDSVKYRRKFYDYNYSQGTLVPYRTVLWANDKQIEETEILTITFGQKVEEDMFRSS
jgi:hypothetical protein